jgi:heme exporter protein B
MFSAAFRREWRLLARQKADWLNPLVFFLLVLTLFPLGVGPKANLLRDMAPGIIWIGALLSVLLAAERLFKDDFRYGVLEQLVSAQQPLLCYVLAKIAANWCSTGLPLMLVSPLVMLLLGLEWPAYQALLLTLLLGTPLLSLMAALGAALTLSADKGGILLALLILPLYIPLLIFASAAVEQASFGVSYNAQLSVLVAMVCLALAGIPYAILRALRLNVG